MASRRFLSSRNHGWVHRTLSQRHTGTFRTQATMSTPQQAQNPLILFDIMDTIVQDPFYERMPAHFGLAFEEVLYLV